MLSKLQGIGVRLWWDYSQIKNAISYLAGGFSPVPPMLVPQTNPLFSCLMLTRGNIELLKHSLAYYQSRSIPNRELVVVAEPEAGEKARAFINLQKILNASSLMARLQLRGGYV